jgi:prepilin-type N-terminal cleavage/methylation domain-containing protein
VSRSLADRLRRRGDDQGFGLVEIMISMTIFAIIVLATAPMLIGGLKAGRSAQLNLQGKALAQERLELMRNLPYHVARQNGQYLDVLDIYFRDLQPTGTLAASDRCSARSYDAATSTYACTINNLGADYPSFSQVIRATFLDFQRNPVTPPAAYNSQVAGVDAPASALLGVAVTTSWTQGSKTSSYTLRSQIANAQAEGSSLQASLSVTALTLSSNLASGDILQLEGGLVSSDGSLTTGSTASLGVATARAGLASGSATNGATLSLSAPPAASGTSPSDPSGHKIDGTCNFACFGQTAVTGNQDVTVALGQPQVSRAADPVVASLRRTGSNTYRGFTYANALLLDADPALRLTGPMVSAGLGSTTEVLNGKGYLDATGTGATAVQSAGSTTVPMLQLFPTDFAPEGVVQLVLTSASLSCASGGGAGAVSATWAGTARYWKQTGISSGVPTGGYVDLNVAPGAAALPDPAGLTVLEGDANGDGVLDVDGPNKLKLDRWVQAWAGMTDTAQAVTSSGQRSTGTINGVISLLTAPTRLTAGVKDETSAINIALGKLTCHAEDNR